MRIAINGFGRIGRLILRSIIENGRSDMQVVGINDLAKAETLGHLLKFDSVHGRFLGEVSVTRDSLIVNGQEIFVANERDPELLPWKKLKVDLVMECTGFFLTQELSGKHLMAGAKKVLMSAPPKDDTKTIVYGINHDTILATDNIVSNASCTTNALAPLLYVLNNEYGIRSGMMTTIHAYTGDQPTHDSVHSDIYRGRAAAVSMVPTTTGAAKAIGRVLPQLDGKLEGVSVRVPVLNVSAVDITMNMHKPVNVEGVRKLFCDASTGPLKGIFGFVEEKLVSSDFNHDSHSSIFIADQILVSDEKMLRIMSWYDNEWGFSNRMLDTASIMFSR